MTPPNLPEVKKIRATVAKEAGQGMPIEKTTATRIKVSMIFGSIRATAAKEVGMKNPAEKTAVRPNQNPGPDYLALTTPTQRIADPKL